MQKLILEKDDQYIDKDEYLEKINKYSLKAIAKKKKKNLNFFIENANMLHPDFFHSLSKKPSNEEDNRKMSAHDK